MRLNHPLLDGTALGVVLSLLGAAGVAIAASRRIFGPSRYSRRPVRPVH